MSRTRIVKGKYIKISAGDHYISAEGNIISNAASEVRDHGVERGVFYGSYERLGSDITDDFEISFSQKKNGIYSTVVPLGILDFKGNFENSFFAFNYSLHLGNVDSLKFEVLAEDGTTIYSITSLPELVVTARKHPGMLENIKKNKPPFNPAKPVNIWDWKPSYDPFAIPVADYTKIGSYVILWDGFDNNDIYDSTHFNNRTLKAIITAEKNGIKKTKEVEFRTSYKEVDWVDVRIDKKNKRIDASLRVNLKDGGAEGLKKYKKISKEALAYYNLPPLTSQARSYKEIEKYTLEGISKFWSRNSANVGRGVNIGSDLFEVYVNAETNTKGLAAPKIVYQTNTKPGRSRNWELSRILYFYEGYLYRSSWRKYPNSIIYSNKGWEYVSADIIDFEMVSAHEIGHEVLLQYGGHTYSKSHKGSTTIITQETLPTSPLIPTTGKVDLMKYYQDYYDISRTVISEFDLLKLIWLTKIKVI